MRISEPKTQAGLAASSRSARPLQATLAVAAAAAMTVLGVVPTAHAGPSDPISVPDPALLECINAKLDPNRIPSHFVTEAEAASLTVLDCQGKGVTEVDGMEYLVSLERAALNNNPVSSLTPLNGLTTLQMLGLNGTGVTDTDLESLTDLTNLTFLGLRTNNIIDVSSLAALTNVKSLHLSGNAIAEVTSLSNLSSLESLYLDANSITDVSTLASLASLEDLWLDENSIADLSSLSTLSLTILSAENQTAELGDLVVDDAVGNPVIDGNGSLVSLDDLYDAGTNTFTPTVLGAGSVGWDDGGAFFGTLSFTVTEADDTGNGDVPGNDDVPGNSDVPGNGDVPGDGDVPVNADVPGDGGVNGDVPGNGDVSDRGGEHGDSSMLAKTGADSSFIGSGLTAGVLLLTGGLVIGLLRRRRA